jgi:hypothetical protein
LGVFDPTEISSGGKNVTEGGDLAGMLGVQIGDESARHSIDRKGVTTEKLTASTPRRKHWTSTAADPGRLVPGLTVLVTDSHLFNAADHIAPYFEELYVIGWQDLNNEGVSGIVTDADRLVLSFSGRFSSPRLRSFARLIEGWFTQP